MRNKDRRILLGILLSLALLLDAHVYGFAPGTGHTDITADALAQISRQVDGQTLRFSERAIGQVVAGNVDADCGGDTPRPYCDCKVCDKDSARHFDSESFLGSTTRLKIRYVLVSLRSDADNAPVVVNPPVVTANADEFLAALNARLFLT